MEKAHRKETDVVEVEMQAAENGASPDVKDDKPQEAAGSSGYFKLYNTADSLDYLLIALGTLGGCGSGIMFPLFAIIFGDFANTFGSFVPDCSDAPPIPGIEPVSPAQFSSDVANLALQFLWVAMGAFVAGGLQQACWAWAGNRQTNRLRQRYLASVLRQDIPFFDTDATTGGLLQGLNEDSIAVQQGISDKVGAFQQHVVTFLVGFIIAFVKGWDMTLVMIGCLPFLAGAAVLLTRVTTTLTTKAQVAYTEAGAVAQQAVSQMRTVAAYNGEARALEDYNSRLDTPQKVGQMQGLLGGASVGFMQFVMFSSYAAALYYGAWRVSLGDYNGGQVLQVLVSSLLGSFSLGLGAPILQTFSKAASAGGRMFSVIERTPAIDPDAPGATLPEVKGEVELKGVVFAYPARPDVPIFNGFSLSVPAGKTVALVGASGSGKSTVVGLIERFYDPAAGQVLLDGHDLRTLQLGWLRSQVGLVSQEPTLFATTIFENIAMGKDGATKADVEAAAASANALRFIQRLPKGFDTMVGERGVALSGGQKQRIAIARAILKNPKILLLDEATSALDSESERIVQQALDRMTVGRTTVVVAHRLSTIKNADIIAVVRAGAIVEQGTHDGLLADPTGAYSTLVKMQLQAQEGDGEEEDAGVVWADAAGEGGVAEGGVVVGGARPPSLDRRRSSEVKRRSLEEAIEAEVLELEASSPAPLPDAHGSVEVVNAVGASTSGVRGWLRRRKGGGKDGGGKKDDAEPKAPKVPMSRLYKMNQPEWPYGLLGCTSSAVVGAVQPIFAFIISSMIAVLTNPAYITNPSGLMAESSRYSWFFFAIACASLVGYSLQLWAFGVMGQRLARRLRYQLFGAMLRQEIGWFDLDENSSGKLATVLASDATHVRGAVADSLGAMLQNLACLAVGYTLAFVYDWRVALLVTGVLPLVVVGALLNLKHVMGDTDRSEEIYGSANQTVSEAFSSIRVIHAYNLQPSVEGLYARLLVGANQAARSSALSSGLAFAYSQFIMFGMYSLVIWFGGVELKSCRATFDEFLIALMAVLLAAMGLSQAQLSFPDLGKAKSAVGRVFPIIDRTPAIDSSDPSGDAPDPATVAGAVELRDVTFRYPSRPEVDVFKGFSLAIPAGKTVALVGESGSGKSTVVGLILRFYDPMAGQVLLDGRDLRSYNLKWLRREIGLVSQEPLLFSTTLIDNIRYGAPEATMEQVMAAARAANAHDFISALPSGYETQVGERGIALSGGQKQRVAIARAVLKDPKILLLDEATSALDAKAEREVQEALDAISKGRTTVVVAHRLSTIRDANVIAVVYQGTIVEQGTHESLMAILGGSYGRLVAAQMRSKGSRTNLRA